MQLWYSWVEVVWQLRIAFSNQQNFLWVVVALASFCTRRDLVGVTSFVRGHWLQERFYHHLLRAFHSRAVDLPVLRMVWYRVVSKIFDNALVRVQGRRVLALDGLKNPKEGRKMPAVKLCHQESTNNSKAEYVMAHSCQAICILVRAVGGLFAVPLTCAIHEGIVQSNRDRRTLLDKALQLVDATGAIEFYLLADAYYGSGRFARTLIDKGNHLVTRLRKNAVAFELVTKRERRRGRPRKYGTKIKLREVFGKLELFQSIPSPLCGEADICLKVCSLDLIWRPLGCVVRFVFAIHPTKGKWLLLSTDLTLSPSQIIELYGFRFKIEVMFKQAIHLLGSFNYRFWMKDMDKISRGDGDQYLHRKTKSYRNAIARKIGAYELHMQLGFIAQGLMQYLAVFHGSDVWSGFGSWLRTMKTDQTPSELVVAAALQRALPEFLANLPSTDILKKFLADKLDWSRCPMFRLTG